MDLLLATQNRYKLREISSFLDGMSLRLLTLQDFPSLEPAQEDGATLEENAAKKAGAAARSTGCWALADDTGLEVAALGGAPGVFSARYGGPECDFARNIRKLLWELRGLGLEERKAVFRCVLALAPPGGEVVLEEGRLSGLIVEEARGERGFGYDPVFWIPSLGKTLAELSLEEKNRISHRSLAIRKMRVHLQRIFRCEPSS
ncbi:MAG: RdgB/HAM1 family non-canonical purine NTP pyrophosphatase [Elusimicrobia bacterium]|nr:RdgB/HAM1 family non-canonical purine NTP pyrophosphatase [Elusimicrobiota bacterium]